MPFLIRDETPADKPSIHAVTEAAFKNMPHAGGDEPDIVDRLRDAGALSVSLVAEKDGRVVGHVAFSDAQASEGRWFALGPVSVLPELQSQGIGSALIRDGLAILERNGASGCVLVGDPAYYKRFGFEAAPVHSPSEDFATHFMMRCFHAPAPDGAVQFHPAFFS